jgi:hypothetical protein
MNCRIKQQVDRTALVGLNVGEGDPAQLFEVVERIAVFGDAWYPGGKPEDTVSDFIDRRVASTKVVYESGRELRAGVS